VISPSPITRQKQHVLEHTLVGLEGKVLLLVNIGEAPLLGDDDLLATGELVTSTAESLHDDGGVLLLATDGEDDLANVDTGDGAVGLTPSATHTGLETVIKEVNFDGQDRTK
jgi:hypothetical protein